MTLGTPVGRDAEVLGAVVMVAPTDPVQDAVAGWLTWLVLGGVAVLGLTVFGVVVPFVGWVMRPVHDLDAAARRLATGDLGSRAHELGPPELRELGRSFNSMADSVETSQRQQRDLVADAAHQLGNPLTALRLRIENLGQPGTDPERVGAALEEADRLDRLVSALLDLSQVGAVAVTPEPRDVAEEVRGRCAMWEPVFSSLEVDVPGRLTAMSAPGPGRPGARRAARQRGQVRRGLGGRPYAWPRSTARSCCRCGTTGRACPTATWPRSATGSSAGASTRTCPAPVSAWRSCGPGSPTWAAGSPCELAPGGGLLSSVGLRPASRGSSAPRPGAAPRAR